MTCANELSREDICMFNGSVGIHSGKVQWAAKGVVDVGVALFTLHLR